MLDTRTSRLQWVRRLWATQTSRAGNARPAPNIQARVDRAGNLVGGWEAAIPANTSVTVRLGRNTSIQASKRPLKAISRQAWKLGPPLPIPEPTITAVSEAPSITEFDSEGARVTNDFTPPNLLVLMGEANLTWFDPNPVLTHAIANPSAFGLSLDSYSRSSIRDFIG